MVPFGSPRCEMITMGKGVIINASKDVMSFIKKRIIGKSRYDALNAPFVYGVNPYFLPDVDNINLLSPIPNFEYKLLEQSEIQTYYQYEGLHNALQYNKDSYMPEKLGVVALSDGKLAGIACALYDCEKMCQLGVDVLPEYRNQGLAKTMINSLTIELINRGRIPYYFTDNTNVVSQKTAVAAGFFPAWSHCFKTRLYAKPFSWLNYLKY